MEVKKVIPTGNSVRSWIGSLTEKDILGIQK